MVEQALELVLGHGSEYFERFQELNAAQEITLNSFFNDTNVRLTVDAGYFAIIHAHESH